MTVFINARFLTQAQSGVQRYAFEVLRALDARWDSGADGPLVALVPERATLKAQPHWSTIELRAVRGGQGHLWEQIAIYQASKRRML